MKFKSAFFLFFIIVSFSCKKENAPTIIQQPVPQPIVFQPGQTLAISQTTNMGLPYTLVNADTVYSAINYNADMFKAMPTGYENKIVSFYLPKGYMAVFAENSDGTGESACYVAAQSAINANLPQRLVNNISFIRYIDIANCTKKGVASTDSNSVKLFNTSWYYGWSINRPSFATQQFVPMTWTKGTATISNVIYLVGRKDVSHLLSFNEPENTSQANIPNIDTAINRYKTMMPTGLRLGAPATQQDHVFGPGDWELNFMIAAQAKGLRVDFIPLHWYDWGNETKTAATDSLTGVAVFSRFKTYIEAVHTKYPTQKIWLTEFNANVKRTSVVVHRVFMRLSTDWMNGTDYLERYSYFFESNLPATDANGKMTELGTYWNNISSPVSFPSNIE